MTRRTRRIAAALVVALVATALVGPATVSGATATTVSLSPSTGSVDSGDTTTFDVVVESADGGVGAYTATVSLDDPSVATITDVSLAGSPGLSDVQTSGDNASATINAALMNTDDTGSVTVATVTVRGAAAGETGVSLSVSALGDESGSSYEVTGTSDAALSVSAPAEPGDPDGVTVSQTPASSTVAPGDTVQFETTVDATGLNAPGVDVDLPAGWSVESQSATGDASYKPSEHQWVWLSGGEYTVTYTVAVPAAATEDTYDVTAEGSAIDPATDERLVDTTQSDVTVETAPGDDPTGDATVAVESATATPGETASLGVTLSEASDGLAGYTLRISVGEGNAAELAGVGYPEGMGLTSQPSYSDDGQTVQVKAADIDGAVDPGASDVTLATVDLQTTSPGRVQVSVDVVRMDDDDGDQMAPATEAGTLSVRPEPVGDSAPPTDPDGDGRFEDVNGNDVFDFDDVVTLFEHLDDPAVTGYAGAYDFNGNGRIDFDDVVALYEEV